MTHSSGRPAHPDQLTPAEWRVAEWVRHGLTNRAIAERLDVSLDAVKFHVGNILSKLALADRRALRLWPGIRLGSALPAGGADQPTHLAQVARSVGDLSASRSFYAALLGTDPVIETDTLCFFDLGGVRLMLSAGPPAPESVLYLGVEDIAAALDRAAASGVTVLAAPHRIHRHPDGSEDWLAFFNDPDGRPLAFSSRTHPQPET
jgi:DNA-binding CsgD family transcriptional regulator/predicted enzyme related to lactoylglutathione lyase